MFGRFSKRSTIARCGEEFCHHRTDDFPTYVVILVVSHLPHLARPAPSVLEHPIIASNMATNGAITAERAYVSRFRVFYVHLMVFHAT
jgi:uncharacterized protein (DUF983 family)